MPTASLSEPTFTIGAVARLTGISVDTLRVWERRYEGLAPARTSTNRRRYGEKDIRRLTLIKQLLDQGHSVGAVAHLSEAALREHLNLFVEPDRPPEPPAGPVPVVLFGETLPFLMKGWANDLPELEIVGSYAVYAEFEKAALGRKAAVLVAEWMTLQFAGIDRLHALMQRVAAGRALAVYGFARREDLEHARKLGISTLKAPVSASTLAAACAGGHSARGAVALPAAVGEIPPRRFDNETLGRLANLQSRLRCECPHHLTDLLYRLNAFEAYSLDCENRDERDADLHARLFRATAQARSLIEAALAHLIKVEAIELEKIPLPDDAAGMPST
jgi:DNA-binding transcriptional MerR regulator